MNETLQPWLEFARGPLFRFTFALLVLGLLRLVGLTIYNLVRTYRLAGDKRILWPIVRERTLWTLIPFKRLHRSRAVYSITSFIFHVGLILVPILLFAHIQLWRHGTGMSWPALPPIVADVLTIVTIVTALVLLISRAASPLSRSLSRFEDLLWPILLGIPFVSGFFASHPAWCPIPYAAMMLIHVLSAELIFVMIPFSKIAHCVLLPFSQLVSDLAWRFPASAGRDVAKALGKESAPI